MPKLTVDEAQKIGKLYMRAVQLSYNEMAVATQECPVCHAAAGSYCTGQWGKPRPGSTHAKRHDAVTQFKKRDREGYLGVRDGIIRGLFEQSLKEAR